MFAAVCNSERERITNSIIFQSLKSLKFKLKKLKSI